MDDVIKESELCLRLGISRDSIASLRKAHLERGVDWRKLGRIVVYTENGAERLIKATGVPFQSEDKKALKEPRDQQNEETLTFIQGNFPNRKIIKAKRENGVMVFVKVKTSENFRPNDHTGKPMTFPAREDGNVWIMTRPHPRWPGKW